MIFTLITLLDTTVIFANTVSNDSDLVVLCQLL